MPVLADTTETSWSDTYLKVKLSKIKRKKLLGASLIAQLVKNPPAVQEIAQFIKNLSTIQETWFNSCVRKIFWRDRLLTPVFLGFPGGSADKEYVCNVGGLGSIPGLGRSSVEGKIYPLQYSGLENSMDGIVHGVAKSWTWQWFFTHLKAKFTTSNF